MHMDIQPELGSSVKIRYYFPYTFDILRDNALKFGRVTTIPMSLGPGSDVDCTNNLVVFGSN